MRSGQRRNGKRGEMANNFESQILLKFSDGDTEMLLMRDGAVIIRTEHAYYTKDNFLAWLADPSCDRGYAQAHLAYLSTLGIETET